MSPPGAGRRGRGRRGGPRSRTPGRRSLYSVTGVDGWQHAGNTPVAEGQDSGRGGRSSPFKPGSVKGEVRPHQRSTADPSAKRVALGPAEAGGLHQLPGRTP